MPLIPHGLACDGSARSLIWQVCRLGDRIPPHEATVGEPMAAGRCNDALAVALVRALHPKLGYYFPGAPLPLPPTPIHCPI